MFSPQATARRRISASVLGIFSGMILVQMFNGVVQGYLPPLLPAVSARLGINTVGLSRLTLLIVLSGAVLIPLLTRLGDLYGHRRMLRISVAAMGVGSLLPAAWPSPGTLAVGSVLQGPSVAVFPLLIGILRSRAPQHNRSGIGLLGATHLASTAAGGLVAGALAEGHPLAGLWVTVPVAALALGGAWWLPESDGRSGGRFNVGAALLLSVGLAGLALAVAGGPTWGWASVPGLISILGGGLALAGWVLVEARTTHPLVNLRLFLNPRLATILGIAFLLNFGAIGFIGANVSFLAASPDQVGYGLGLGPRSIALVSVVLLGTGAVSASLAPLVLRRFGERLALAAGAFLTATSFILMALWHDTLAEYLIGLVVLGMSLGLFGVVSRTLAVEAVTERETAVVAGLVELSLAFASTVGASVISALFAAHPLGRTGYVAVSGYLWCWVVCGGVAIVGLALALAYHGRHPTPTGTEARTGTAEQTA